MKKVQKYCTRVVNNEKSVFLEVRMPWVILKKYKPTTGDEEMRRMTRNLRNKSDVVGVFAECCSQCRAK